MAESTIMSLKLLIDTHGKRVVLAEANKNFVDFLFRLISLPFSTIIGLLRQQERVGSFANLYKSIETLNDPYIQPNQTNQTKDALLKSVLSTTTFPLFTSSGAPAPATTKTLYGCNDCLYVSENVGVACPDCWKTMELAVFFVDPQAEAKHGEGGIVKGVGTYMVMDDLEVKPMSTISTIAVLNKFNIKDVSALEEKEVNFGIDEALKLVNASWQSEKVLTDVFLEGSTGIKSEGLNFDYQFI